MLLTLLQDSLRRFYWLLNAFQATGDMISESLINRARPVLQNEIQGELELFPGDNSLEKGKPSNLRAYTQLLAGQVRGVSMVLVLVQRL